MKEFLSHHAVPFTARDISTDEQALADLVRLQLMTTPVTTIDGETVVGFDEAKLTRLLGL